MSSPVDIDVEVFDLNRSFGFHSLAGQLSPLALGHNIIYVVLSSSKIICKSAGVAAEYSY